MTTASSAPAREAPPELPVQTKRLIVLGVVVTTAAGALGTAFLPYFLVENPLVLLLLSSDGRNVVLVAPQVSLPTMLAIAVPRRILAMLVTYGLGALYGRTMLAWSERTLPRLARALGWFERLFVRFERALLLFWPTYTTAVLAGVTRMPVRRFAPWMAVGQAGYVVVIFYVGDALSVWTDALVAALARHVWEATAVTVFLVSTQQIVSFVRRRRAKLDE